MPATLRSLQRAELERMFSTGTAGDDESPPWKALILDSHSQGIISSSLRVNDLLAANVAIHSLITAPRTPLPDAPAVYFVAPTQDNITRIVTDLARDVYHSYAVNFTSALPRGLLEEFARRAAATGRASQIILVFDRNVDYVVAEANLFSLEMPGVYRSLGAAATTESEIDALVSGIAARLFDVIASGAGAVPILKYPRGGAAEAVATKLALLLRDWVANGGGTGSLGTATRPVLILLDRSFDLRLMVCHSWIYSCMVADVFKLERNRITVPAQTAPAAVAPATGAAPAGTATAYDIDPNDFFWAANAGVPFPDAVENVEVALAEYKSRAAALTGASDTANLDPDATADTSAIARAIKDLPALAARKITIDMHMTILAALLAALEARRLDKFFEIEQNGAVQQFGELILDAGAAAVDKVRTLVALALSGADAAAVDKCEAALVAMGADVSALAHVRRVQAVALLGVRAAAPAPSFTSRLGLADGMLAGLRRFLPPTTNLPITDLVEAVMQGRDTELHAQDPAHAGGVNPSGTYAQAIVFVVGGGNFLEYQNLHGSAEGANIWYGATAILNPGEFLAEMGGV